jgi:hypothetical protein
VRFKVFFELSGDFITAKTGSEKCGLAVSVLLQGSSSLFDEFSVRNGIRECSSDHVMDGARSLRLDERERGC